MKGRYRLQIQDRARRDLAIDIAWWRLNRSSAPDAIREELVKARDLLERNPEAGPPAEDHPGVCRLLLTRVSYHLYYRVNHAARQIEIVCLLAHAAKASGAVSHRSTFPTRYDVEPYSWSTTR